MTATNQAARLSVLVIQARPSSRWPHPPRRQSEIRPTARPPIDSSPQPPLSGSACHGFAALPFRDSPPTVLEIGFCRALPLSVGRFHDHNHLPSTEEATANPISASRRCPALSPNHRRPSSSAHGRCLTRRVQDGFVARYGMEEDEDSDMILFLSQEK